MSDRHLFLNHWISLEQPSPNLIRLEKKRSSKLERPSRARIHELWKSKTTTLRVGLAITQSPSMGKWNRVPLSPKCGKKTMSTSKSLTVVSGWDETPYPCCAGHEIIGRVVRKGKNVKKFKLGDRVGVGPQARSCLKTDCPECSSGKEVYCRDQIETYGSIYPDGKGKSYGGYANYNRTHQRFVVNIPHGLPSEDAVPSDNSFYASTPDNGELPNVDAFTLIFNNINFVGSAAGSPDDIEEMLHFAVDHNVKPMVQMRSLSEANQVIQDIEAGKARYRYVPINENHLDTS
ncbi:uncharacterized protein ASPGLDRAFT_28130 [Aspergillus glaucus CBS 516.65]|uniref:Alcohol dehydrogenase-like N-terminal domain-containing protein n=1 Tax=Aspergillus glaucus CBS 516.65 TaxID=1160497 RepID=A0A1L9VBH0_ASPGL|nr:hypothetical protein ASPGLDRAFT_28130 [Aspergillus glaucus CBS 516.65]OJJ81287.1 hypothetical protein ASPGLDRAFT_28130 [Aspergillus glaucus CBS 516.65]